MKVARLGEKKLIERVTRLFRVDRSVMRGVGDDCAVLQGPRGKWLLFASDMLVEGVHFRRAMPAEGIGWKALAVNLSDIAAMGGVARHAVISLGIPRGTSVSFVDRLYSGLRRCASRFHVNLVGGDTDRAPCVVVDVAILGEVEPNRAVYRSGARAGDAVLVTGRLGGSLRSGRHLSFTPRLAEARKLTAHAKISAMIDLSDGLGPDLTRLCEASGVACQLHLKRIPRNSGCSPAQALTDGEDFELLFTVPSREAPKLLRWAKKSLPCGLTQVGRIIAPAGKQRIRIVAPSGMKLPASLQGFQHF